MIPRESWLNGEMRDGYEEKGCGNKLKAEGLQVGRINGEEIKARVGGSLLMGYSIWYLERKPPAWAGPSPRKVDI